MSESFTPSELRAIEYLSFRVKADAEWYGARLVVQVCNKDDDPVAWIGYHPEDETPTIQFIGDGDE